MAGIWQSSEGDSLIRRGIRISLVEGAVIGAMFAATENWLVPLLTLRLGASASLIGYLTTIPQLGVISVGMIARPLISRLGGNRRTVLMTNVVQVLMLFGLMVPAVCPIPHRVAIGMIMAVTLGLAGSLGGPAWTSWMGDLIPRTMMGRYSSWRTRIFLPMKLGWGLGFSLLLHTWPVATKPGAIAAVFAIAALSRLASTILLFHQPVPPIRPVWRGPASHGHPVANVTLVGFVRSMGRTHIGTWTLVWSTLLFGVFVSTPFFAPYYITSLAADGLGLGAWRYWVLCNVSVVARLVVVPVVGRAVDLVGPTSMLRIGVIGISINMVPYIFTQQLWILVVAEVVGGVSACMAEISMGVLLFSCNRDPLQRVRLIGYYQVMVGSAVVLGSLVGTQLLQHLQSAEMHHSHLVLYHSPFRTLFAISFALRLPALLLAILLLPRLRSLNTAETAGLWRLVPGSSLTLSLGRGLIGVFRRSAG